MNFIYNTPTKIYFGKIQREALHDELIKYGKKILLLTGGIYTQKIAYTIYDLLKDDFDVTMYTGIETNPQIENIEKISNMVNTPIDSILTIGGGSIHDAGKALSVSITYDNKLEEYITTGEIGVAGIQNNVIPIITIPTIFGTGAEVSPASLIKVKNEKKIIFSPYLYPRASFIDCGLSSSISRELCIKVSLDAFVQGIESLVSIKAQSFSRRFSLSAIERVVSSLIKLSNDNLSSQLMEELAIAAIESMYAVGQSTVGAVHAISDPISGRYNIHHGEAVGVLLPYVIDANYEYSKEEYDIVKNLLETKMEQSYAMLSEAIFSFYNKIGFDIKSFQKKIPISLFEQDYKKLILESKNSDMEGNPRLLTDEIIGDILKKSFGA